MKVLGIETSCDETGVAIYDTESTKIVSEQLYSQASKHAEYGGVVPELASRDHLKKLIPLIKLTVKEAGLNLKEIDAVAYTSGPGLRGPLLIGASTAKSIALALNKPSVGIHHMEAHLLINLLEDPAPSFPFLTLLISGGHCLLINAKSLGDYEILGQTLDDAVGEAFDKVAKILDLGYPGGPKIEELAKTGDPTAFQFPRPMTNKNNFNFSFSGLKTSLLYFMDDFKETKKLSKKDIIASYQQAIIDVLIKKVITAMKINSVDKCVIAGGVAANHCLRNGLRSVLGDNKIMFPDLSYCTDNGAMISYLGEKKIQLKKYESLSFSSQPNLKLS